MIQRVQTLFLLEIAFLSISLLFVPFQFIFTTGIGEIAINLSAPASNFVKSGWCHIAAIALNYCAILISTTCIFLYKKRPIQVKLCYFLFAIFMVLLLMLSFCDFVSGHESESAVRTNVMAYLILIICAISSWLAARYIKKDIELLKSTDRIR
jgi:hypothetical protein